MEGVFEHGRTHPLILDCILEASDSTEEAAEGQPERRLMLVKALGLPEVAEIGLFREVFGNLIAREIGVNTAQPALVNLSQPLVETLNPSYNFRLQAGIGAGCEYLRGLTGISPGAPLTVEEAQQATLIYGFDLLVQNPDRRKVNPNCAIQNSRLIAFDFELCFSFINLVGSNAAPWQVSQHGIAAEHVFHPIMRSRTVDWQPLLEAVNRLGQKHLEQLATCLPEAWQEWASKVNDHLLQVKENIHSFELEMQRSLL